MILGHAIPTAEFEADFELLAPDAERGDTATSTSILPIEVR